MPDTESGKSHLFGGDWTRKKLHVLQRYLKAYATALKDKPYTKGYIDAFAGTGSQTLKAPPGAGESSGLLFPEFAAPESQAYLDGSVRLALKTEPRFDRYVFIERSAKRCLELEALKDEFPRHSIRVENGDANEVIRKMCARNWEKHRAVMFLDPYGMQVEWSTLEAIAKTRAIDLWILFPLGIGVVRLLTRSGEIPASWRKRLDLLLGTSEWYDEFYHVETRSTLFDDDQEVRIKASAEVIGRYFNRRLSTIFAGVAERPMVLFNSTGCPLYLFCFAVANPHGVKVALRIADHLLRGD